MDDATRPVCAGHYDRKKWDPLRRLDHITVVQPAISSAIAHCKPTHRIADSEMDALHRRKRSEAKAIGHDNYFAEKLEGQMSWMLIALRIRNIA
jgi:hypothetical protein